MSHRTPLRSIVALAVLTVLLTAAAVVAGPRPPDAGAVSPGVDTVYVANGITFADALAGGPNASLGGSPLLLVTADAIPLETLDELIRLQPGEVVVLGGTAAISDAVEADLAALTVPAGNVRRIAGANRFETAAALSRELPDGIDADTLGGRAPDDFLSPGDLDDYLTGADADRFVAAGTAEGIAIALERNQEIQVAGHGPASYWLQCLDSNDATRIRLVARSTADDWYHAATGPEPIAEANVGTDQAAAYDVFDAATADAASSYGIDGDSIVAIADGVAHRLSIQLETSPYVINDLGHDCVLFATVFRSELAVD